MKTNSTYRKKITALLAAGLFGAVVPGHAAPKLPPSPIFTNGVAAWDCLITGPQGERGIMLLTFSNEPDGYGNYTFNLRQIHTKIPTSIPRVAVTVTNAPNGRGGSSSRGDTVIDNGSNTNASTNLVTSMVGTNIYGYLRVSGSWGFDYKGNILGFYIEKIATGASSTNITYITNQVSFIGKATPNKRFTALYYSTIGGNGKYSGVPQKVVTNHVNGSDFSGPWTGNEILGPVNTVELFTLYASDMPNAYDITGDGPGYTLDWLPFGIGPFQSKCLVSCQHKIAFSDYKFMSISNSVSTLRATFGDLKDSAQVVGGNTKGLVQTGADGSSGSNAVYNAYFVPYVPYP